MRYVFENYKKNDIISGHLRMGGVNPDGECIDANNICLLRNGKPWIPVMGEFHFSRYERAQWKTELCKMKAGGITLVSTYIFWIHHEETEGNCCFEGNLDIRAFITACQEVGMEVVLRIGPWVHGECRNGGFPDWLTKKPFALRKNIPEYLDLVRIWYGRIAEQIRGLCFKDGGNIIAIQLENELADSPQHLLVLKKIAVECGIEVPLYTVTGWKGIGGAQIPIDEVLPVFGGYCEAPWAKHMEKMPPSMQYFFSRMRNDSAIGEDLMPLRPETGWQLPYERYPFATCELGGGIQITHHRRPIIRAMDIYTIALVKLGCGNNLPGYYMYHGGTNPVRDKSTFQESRATGYPNDYPILSYDFQAPLSEFGEVREHYRLLNLLHLFLQDFQEDFAELSVVDAQNVVNRNDVSSLRYSMRTNGEKGYIFVNHYQRLSKLEDISDVVIDTGNVVFPSVNVRGEICFFFPFMMELKKSSSIDETKQAVILRYATAQPICRMENTYFFMEIPGIEAEYCFDDETKVKAFAGRNDGFIIDGIQIITLTWEEAKYLRRLELNDQPSLFLGNGCDLYAQEGKLYSVEEGKFVCYCFDGVKFNSFHIGESYREAEFTRMRTQKPDFEMPHFWELQLGGDRKTIWEKLIVPDNHGFVTIEDTYDVAQIYADECLVADNYYYGLPWKVPASLLYGKECYLVMSEIRNDFYREDIGK